MRFLAVHSKGRLRHLALGLVAAFGTSFAGCGVVMAQETVQGPRFETDFQWPKPLPNHWILGEAVGVAVDAENHIWMIHRGSSTLDYTEKFLEAKAAECCQAAPHVLEFDQAGNLLRSWGGPGEGYEWPTSVHGLFIDYKGNVWIAANGKDDSHILKFTRDGKFLLQVGKKGARSVPGAKAGEGVYGAVPDFKPNSNDPVSFGRVADIFVDEKANEAYIADGYLNKRVAVIDADTGKLKRYWGAYGNATDDTPQPTYSGSAPVSKVFRNPVHCVGLSVDRLLYVCDRVNGRLQVFTPEGKFVKEAFYDKDTLASGSVWDLAFSKDPQQRYLYVADGSNAKVRVIDRQSLQTVTEFGAGGHQPGQFIGVHSLATDQDGNIYTTETWVGKRIQRFLFKGVGPVPRKQGVAWPPAK